MLRIEVEDATAMCLDWLSGQRLAVGFSNGESIEEYSSVSLSSSKEGVGREEDHRIIPTAASQAAHLRIEGVCEDWAGQRKLRLSVS